MTGARLVHDTLEAGGLGRRDRRCAEGQGPRAAGLQDRQDRLARPGDALASATWCRRSGCPIRGSARSASSLAFGCTWSSTSSMLKHRIHSTLINFGRPCPVTDLFGVEGRRLLETPPGPRALARQRHRLGRADRRPRATRSPRSIGGFKEGHADHPYIPLLDERPGDRLGTRVYDRRRDRRDLALRRAPPSSTGYTGPLSAGHPVGRLRTAAGRLTKHGPRYLRWALLEATMHALQATRPTESATSATSAGSASSAAPRSPRSTSPAVFPTRSGTCFLATRSSLREAPLFVWRPDRPFWTCARERTILFRLILPPRRP